MPGDPQLASWPADDLAMLQDLIEVAPPAAIEDAARALLLLASLARAAGRDDLAVPALADGLALLEHAAGLRRARW